MGKQRNANPVAQQWLQMHGGSRYANTQAQGLKPFGEYDAYSLAPQTTKKQQQYGRGINQGKFDKMTNGLAKFGIKTLTRTAAGLGYVGGALDAIASEISNPEEDNFSKVYDNALVNGLSELEQKYAGNESFEIFKQRAYEGNILDQMMTTDFWAEDFGDGLSFLVSAAIGAKGANVGVKGIGALTQGTRVGNALTATGNATGIAASDMATGIATIYNTINEAGVEAHEVNKKVYEDLLAKGIDPKLAKERAARAAQQTFVANSMLLTLPNAIQSSMFTHAFDDTSDVLNRMIKNQKLDLEDASVLGETGKAMLTNIASEGLWEENVQLAAGNYFERMAQFSKDPNIDEMLTGIATGMIDNFSTDEGQKSMMLGAILGGGSAAVTTPFAVQNDNKRTQQINEHIAKLDSQLYDTMPEAIYETDKEGNIAYDVEGNPVINTDALSKLVYNGAMDKALLDEYTRTQLAGDKQHGQVVKDMAMSRYAYQMLDNNQYGSPEQAAELLKLVVNKRKGEIDTENPNTFSVDSELASNLTKIDGYKQLYKDVDRKTRSLGGNRSMFDNELKKAAFGAGVRQQTFNQLALEAEQKGDSEIAGTYQKMADDAGRNYKRLTSKKSQAKLYETWKETSMETGAIELRLLEAQQANDVEGIYSANKDKRINSSLHGVGENMTANDFTVLGQDPEDQVRHTQSMAQDIQYKVGNGYINRKKVDDAVDEGRDPSEAIAAQLEAMDEVGPEFGNTARKYLGQELAYKESELNKLEAQRDKLKAKMSPEAFNEDGTVDEDAFLLPDEFADVTAEDRQLKDEYSALQAQVDAVNESIIQAHGVQNQLDQKQGDTRERLTWSKQRDGVLFYESVGDMEQHEYTISQGQSEGFTDSITIAAALQNAKRDKAFYNERIEDPQIREQVNTNFQNTIDGLELVLDQVEERKRNIFKVQELLNAHQLDVINHVLGTEYGDLKEARHAIETGEDKSAVIQALSDFVREVKKANVDAHGVKAYSANPSTYIAYSLGRVTQLEYRTLLEQAYADFQTFRDLTQLQSRLVKSGMPQEDIEGIAAIAQNHIYHEVGKNLHMELRNPINYETILGAINDSANEMGVYPTPQQLIAIRQIVAKYFVKDSNADFPNTALLSGVAGTGKTTMVGLALDAIKRVQSANVTQEEILATGHNSHSSKIIAESLGTRPMSFEEVMNTDLINYKIVVVDEIGGITTAQANKLKQKLANNDVFCLLLGDPTQITPPATNSTELIHTTYFNDVQQPTNNITRVQPLSLVMRTGISDIATVASQFRANTNPVTELQASASHSIGDATTTPTGVHLTNSPETLMNRLKQNLNNGRSKLVIVDNQDAKGKYEGLNDPQLQVLTAFEAQGATVQEAYVDIPTDAFNTADLNRVLYTSTSRPTDYLVLAHQQNYTQIQNDNIRNDGSAREEQLGKLKEDFNNSMEQELGMYDVPVSQPVTEETKPEEREEAEFDDSVTVSQVTQENAIEVVEELVTTEEPMADIPEDTEVTSYPEGAPDTQRYFDDPGETAIVTFPTASQMPSGSTVRIIHYKRDGKEGIGLFNDQGDLTGILDVSDSNFNIPKELRQTLANVLATGNPVVIGKSPIGEDVLPENAPHLGAATVIKNSKAQVRYKPTSKPSQGHNGASAAIQEAFIGGYFPNASYEDLMNNSFVYVPQHRDQRGKRGKELQDLYKQFDPDGVENSIKLVPGVPHLIIKPNKKARPLVVRMGVRPMRSNEVPHLKEFKNNVQDLVDSTSLEYPSKNMNYVVRAFSDYFTVRKGQMVENPAGFTYEQFEAAYKRITKEDVPSHMKNEFNTYMSRVPQIAKAVYGVKKDVYYTSTKEEAEQEAKNLGFTDYSIQEKNGNYRIKVGQGKNGKLHKRNVLKYGQGAASQEMLKLALANKSLRHNRPLRRTTTIEGMPAYHSVPLLGESNAYAKELLKKIKDFIEENKDITPALGELATVAPHGEVPINGVMRLMEAVEGLGYEQSMYQILATTDQVPPLTLEDLSQITDSFDSSNHHSLEAQYLRNRDGRLELHEGNTYLRPHISHTDKVPASETNHPIFDKLWDNVNYVNASKVEIGNISMLVGTPSTAETAIETIEDTFEEGDFFSDEGFDNLADDASGSFIDDNCL